LTKLKQSSKTERIISIKISMKSVTPRLLSVSHECRYFLKQQKRLNQCKIIKTQTAIFKLWKRRKFLKIWILFYMNLLLFLNSMISKSNKNSSFLQSKILFPKFCKKITKGLLTHAPICTKKKKRKGNHLEIKNQ